jgi:NPCBM/NEW2 domain-containing protein
MGENPDGGSRPDWKLNPTGDAPEPGPGKKAVSGALAEAKGAWATRGGKIVAIVPAVAALVIGILAGQLTGGGGGTTDVAGPTVTYTETVAAAPQGGSGAGGGAAASDSAAPDTSSSASAGAGGYVAGAAGVGTVSLVNLTPASGPFKSSDTSPVINGKAQNLAICQDMSYYTRNGDAGYNLSRDYTQFSALLGLDDSSAQSSLNPTVEIDGDGLKLAVYTPTLGKPVQITLNVTNVLRLDLIWSTPNAGATNNAANVSGTLVFGNAQLTTVPGYHPSPGAGSSN